MAELVCLLKNDLTFLIYYFKIPDANYCFNCFWQFTKKKYHTFNNKSIINVNILIKKKPTAVTLRALDS